MSEQEQMVQQQGQPQQVTLSDFLLIQRRTMDRVVMDYENNMSQMAAQAEELQKKNAELQAEIEKLKNQQEAPAPTPAQ